MKYSRKRVAGVLLIVGNTIMLVVSFLSFLLGELTFYNFLWVLIVLTPCTSIGAVIGGYVLYPGQYYVRCTILTLLVDWKIRRLVKYRDMGVLTGEEYSSRLADLKKELI